MILSEGHLDQHFNWTKTPRHRERGRPWRIYQALPNEHTIKRDKIRTRGKKKKKGRGDGEWRQTKERKRKGKRERRGKSEGQFAEARRLITSQLRTPDIHN